MPRSARRWRSDRAMTTGPILAAVLAAVVVGAGLIRRWLTRRQIATLARELTTARTERDAARGTAAVADRRAELTIAQAAANDAGRRAAERIADVPTTGSPADRVRAVDAAARRLSDEDDPGGPAGPRRGAAVPPRR